MLDSRLLDVAHGSASPMGVKPGNGADPKARSKPLRTIQMSREAPIPSGSPVVTRLITLSHIWNNKHRTMGNPAGLQETLLRAAATGTS